MSYENYLDIEKLSARSGLSLATLHRLKRAGKIPFFQPAGKGGRILFPPDAIERAGRSATDVPPKVEPAVNSRQHLSGRMPEWMKP